MKKTQIIKISLCAIVIALFLSIIIVTASDSQIYKNTLRLHVLAESDSEEDQSLKLKVRDGVLEFLEDPLCQCENQNEAKETVNSMLPEIQKHARQIVLENGYDYTVKVELISEVYPRKSYEDATLPAGKYNSLKITIGKGEGHNWWCVLYPPLCLSSACAEEEFVKAGFTPGQISVLTGNDSGKYQVRLRIVEIASSIWNKIFK